MIDFSNYEINKFKYYGGKNGGKFCIKYNGEDYMLKFPPLVEHSSTEYSNSCISEYVSCQILKSIGFNVQETLLGKYFLHNKEKIVVACKDFTSTGLVLRQFAELKNSQIETSNNGYGTELSEILETIDKINMIIDDTPFISEIRKRFYKEIITKRYYEILRVAYDEIR